jgi:F-type H+-transporting ATPase subunit gamma
MKMVAAAKLRRAQEQAMAARPYAEAMDKSWRRSGRASRRHRPALLAGTGSDKVHL